MEFVSTQRYVRLSPRKLREVADVVRKLTPARAVATLPFIQKKGAVYFSKAIKTSIANAVAKGANQDDLVFREIQVSEGPRLKRFKAGSRGVVKPVLHRMSHIRIVLETKTIQKSKVKVQKSKPYVKTQKKGKKKNV